MILEPKITYPWDIDKKINFLEKSPGVHFCKIQRNHQLKKESSEIVFEQYYEKKFLSKTPSACKKSM